MSATRLTLAPIQPTADTLPPNIEPEAKSTPI